MIVTLVTVKITSLKYGGYTFTDNTLKDNMLVYGEVTVEGTTAGPIEIVSVGIKAGTTTGDATDTSGLGTEPFSTWSFLWDTTIDIQEGSKYKLEAIATDKEDNSDIDYLNVTIGQNPKPPVILEDTISPSNNLTGVNRFEDRTTSSGLTIKGNITEPNWDSKLLEHSKLVKEVSIVVKNSDGDSVYPVTLNTESGLKELGNGIYSWSIVWPTRTQTGTGFEFPNGNYTIEITAKDNTQPLNLISSKLTRQVTLHHIVKPSAVITAITATKNAKGGDAYSPTGIDTTKIFKFQGDKGKSEVTLKFDLSGSRDPDGQALDYYLDSGDGKTYKWISDSIIEHEYIYSTEKKVEKNYKIKIKIRDEDNAEDDIPVYGTDDVTNLTVIIEFRPEDPEPTIFPEEYTLSLSELLIRIFFIILLIVFNIVAVMMIVNKSKKIDKRRRTREAAIDSARLKRMEEGVKQKEDIYSHLQFEDTAAEAGETHVAVSGAAAAMALPSDEQLAAVTDEPAQIAQPEAPQLVSVEQPVFESSPDYETESGMEPATDTTTAPAQAVPTQPLAAPATAAAPALPAATTPVPAPVAPAATAPAAPAPAQPAQPAAAAPAPAQPVQPAQPQTQVPRTEEQE